MQFVERQVRGGGKAREMPKLNVKIHCSLLLLLSCHAVVSSDKRQCESLSLSLPLSNLINLSIKQAKNTHSLLLLFPPLHLLFFFLLLFSALHFQQHFPALALKANFISISKWRLSERERESIMLLIGSLLLGGVWQPNGRGCRTHVEQCLCAHPPEGN